MRAATATGPAQKEHSRALHDQPEQRRSQAEEETDYKPAARAAAVVVVVRRVTLSLLPTS